jgi:hypothetical protein
VANAGLKVALFSVSCRSLVRVANKGLMLGASVRVARKGFKGKRLIQLAATDGYGLYFREDGT